MTDPTAEAWPEPPLAGAEAAAVLGALERRRAASAWKCSGLDAAGLRATLGSSTITLGGLLKHLAHVEDCHFARLWIGSPVGAPWDAVDGCSAPDRDHRSAAEDTPEALHAANAPTSGASFSTSSRSTRATPVMPTSSVHPSTGSRGRTRRGEAAVRPPGAPAPRPAPQTPAGSGVAGR